MNEIEISEKLKEYVFSLTIIDTHEHLPLWESEREKETDVIKEYLSHYFNSDLLSSGLSPADYEKALDVRLPILERWRLLEPYWEICRLTGYGRSLDIAAKGLYGIEQIDGTTIESLNEEFKKSFKPGWFRYVLKERSKIETSLLHKECIYFDADKDLYTIVLHTDSIVWPRFFSEINEIGSCAGISICSFDTWLEAVDKLLETAIKNGVRIFKNALAYSRSLKYDRRTRQEAEASFNKLFTVKHIPTWLDDAICPEIAFQDYMMHYILAYANRNNITFQYHTGIHEGNGNFINNSDPALLSNLFLEYPDVDFDIFHIGFPFEKSAGVLAKNFPNVYLDMCWAHMISPVASVWALYEWLDYVPVNKISAFGGDYLFIDAVYGHQLMAREDVCKTLSMKIKDKAFGIDKACEIAEMLFYKNPKKIFKL